MKKLLIALIMLLANTYATTLEVKSSEGSGSYVEAVYINGKAVTLPKLHDESYMGHDKFHLDGDVLVREYPIYKPGDPNCCPTGGMKTIRYEGLVR